jgi:DegV family protein with EDD domain
MTRDMDRLCILTDDSVQFTRDSFPGDMLVNTLPAIISTGLPQARINVHQGSGGQPGREPASVERIAQSLKKIQKDHSEVLVLTLSSALSSLFSLVEKVIKKNNFQGCVQVIDSQTTSIGLGLLVQLAAGCASLGETSQEIERKLRVSIPHIYTLFCLPNLSYLASANFISSTQAIVGEMLDLLPIFMLEDGCLAPIQKVRTQRHLLETFQEFIEEFMDPYYIAIIKNGNHYKTQTFQDHLATTLPRTSYSEQMLGVSLSGLLGPQSIGLIVIENKL